jgi:hypothetical protein
MTHILHPENISVNREMRSTEAIRVTNLQDAFNADRNDSARKHPAIL